MQRAADTAVDVEALKKGDEATWDQFFQDVDPLIRSVVSWNKWHFDPHTREDVAQTIRTQLAKAIDQFKADSRLDYYVKKICVRRCIDQVRKQARERERFVSTTVDDENAGMREMEIEAGEDYNPIARVMRVEKIKALRRSMLEIDETCLWILEQFYMKGLSYKDIAERAGITVNAVGLRLSKCVAKMASIAREDPVLSTYFSI